MKRILKEVFNFLKESLNFFHFILEVVYNGNFNSKLKKSTVKTAVVLANGPSLKKELPKLTHADEFKNVDFIVLNYFANEAIFFQIKPKHYCFADPMFFQESHRSDEVKKLFLLLQGKIDWEIFFYVPSNRYHSFIKFAGFKNNHIKIVKINSTSYSGYERFRNYFYKAGLAMPMAGTVANLAIFVALNKSYKKINLYGVDHTFFDSLCVNERNQLCNKQKHFYSVNSSELKPVLRIDSQKPYKISDYLDSIMIMFRSHDYLYKYSSYLKVKILNCTENSMIDSYNRKSFHKE
jgi:hypothetical protein